MSSRSRPRELHLLLLHLPDLPAIFRIRPRRGCPNGMRLEMTGPRRSAHRARPETPPPPSVQEGAPRALSPRGGFLYHARPPQMRGGAVWQLVGLITRRSQVQILPPLPQNLPPSDEEGGISGFSGPRCQIQSITGCSGACSCVRCRLAACQSSCAIGSIAFLPRIASVTACGGGFDSLVRLFAPQWRPRLVADVSQID